MEKCFYDYQKNRYSIIEQYADNYYFIKGDKSGKYYIVEDDDSFQATRKPLKSVFNKYDSKSMYDIQGLFGEGLPGAEAAEQWKDFKQEVYMLVQEQLWRDEQFKREEEAKKRGWRYISAFESNFDDKTGQLIISDKETGREFGVVTQEPHIDFSSFNKEDQSFYGEMWVSGYNSEFGDTDFATKNADGGMMSYRRCDELFTSSSPENRSHVFTEDLCQNIVNAILNDANSEKFSPFISRAFAELQFMEILEIPLESNTLLGDVKKLHYDYIEISNRIEENLTKAIAEKKKKIVNEINTFCEKKELPLYVVQTGVALERETPITLQKDDGWELEAIRFIDPQLKKPMYQVEAVYDNEYSQQRERLIMGTCKEADILRLTNKSTSTFVNAISDNAMSSKEAQNRATNIMQ